MPQKRKSSPPPFEISKLTIFQIERGLRKLRLRIEEVNSLNPESTPYDDAEVDSVEANIHETVLDIFGPNSPEFHEHKFYKVWHGGYNMMESDAPRQAKFAAGIPQAVKMLQGLISRLEEKREDLKEEVMTEKRPEVRPPVEKSRQVFIVHGHDELNTSRLEKLLQDRWHLEPIILKSEAGKGRTLIEKFEQVAQRAAYALVLFSPDDLVEVSGTKYTQARPNAIFELGWFYGRLGRKKVCILFKKGTKIPSDLGGIIRIEFDESIKEKIEEIEKELVAAGLLEKR